MVNTPESRPAEPRPVRHIFLVGFMGSGKTTVGRALGRRLGRRFLDLDEFIEQREGRTIAQIFREHGEIEFRRIEKATLMQLISESSRPTIVALGGGAFVQPGTGELLFRSGFPTIFLDEPASVLWRRCLADPVERPLRGTFEEFQSLYDARRPHYLKAAHRVEGSGRSAEQIAKELVVLLEPESQISRQETLS